MAPNAPAPDTRTPLQKAADEDAATRKPKLQPQTLEQHIALGGAAGSFPLPGFEVKESPALTVYQETGSVPADLPRKKRKVVATQTGYYAHVVRQRGDVFIQDDAVSPFSSKWMKLVSDKTPEKVTGPNQVIAANAERLQRERMASHAGGSASSPSPDASDPLGVD